MSRLDLVWLDGEYLTAEQASVSAFDRGLAYGDGAFTTLRVGGGEPLLLERHLARLGRDLAALYIPPPEAGELESACYGLIQRLQLHDAVLKITVTRGAGGRGPLPPEDPSPTALVSVSSLPPPRSPLRAVTVPDERGAPDWTLKLVGAITWSGSNWTSGKTLRSLPVPEVDSS